MKNSLFTKHNIIEVFTFILGIAIIVAALCPFYGSLTDIYIYDILAIKVKCEDIKLEPNDSLQVLFLGDSECYSCFDPNYLYKEYGYNSFNCGTSAQKICDSYAIAYKCYDNQSPDVIVLETNNLFRSTNPVDDHWDPVLNTLLKKVPVFANHSYWKPIARKLLPRQHELNRRKNKGYLKREDVVPYKGGEYMKETSKSRKIKKDVISYLSQLNDVCKEHGTTLLLVSSPSAVNWNYKKHNSVQKWAEDNSVDYIDMNLEDIGINWKKDTKDGGDHMNKYGAQKVTDFMGNYFKERYNMNSDK